MDENFKTLTRCRINLLKVLSEKEFSLDFHIEALEAVQDAQAFGEEAAEKVAKIIADAVLQGKSEDEIIEKARFNVDYGKYVFNVKKALERLDVAKNRIEKLMRLYEKDISDAFNRGWSPDNVAANMNDAH